MFGGDLSTYEGNQSSADLALCGELARRGLGGGGIDTAVRASSLYREKWERDDYRSRTIRLALEGVAAPSVDEPKADLARGGAEAESGGLQPGALDLSKGEIAISLAEPPPRNWLIDRMVLQGKSAVLAGFGGVSKTQLAIQFAIAVALGTPFAGRDVQTGRVLMLLGEEDHAEVSRRISAIARHDSWTPTQIERVSTSVRAFPLVGQDMRLTAMNFRRSEVTQTKDEIIRAIRNFGDVRLVVLDHLALLHGGDFNAREDAAVTMRVINDICHQTGAAVIVLAHTPKSAATAEESNASMIAGSTAFVDQARGAMILTTMREQEAKKWHIPSDDRQRYVSLAVVKNNYGPTGEVLWFERVPFDSIALLAPVDLPPQIPIARGAAGLEAKLIEFVRNNPGQYAKTRLRDTQSGKTKGPFRASKAELEGAIENLLKSGRLVNRPPTTEERQRFGHTARVAQVLDVS